MQTDTLILIWSGFRKVRKTPQHSCKVQKCCGDIYFFLCVSSVPVP